MGWVEVAKTADTIFVQYEGEMPERTGVQHFHVRAHGVHACVTGIAGDTEAEAEDNALFEFEVSLLDRAEYADWGLDDIYGNREMTFCTSVGGCNDECGGAVHLTRMEDSRQPAATRVLIFDL
jgi:hypothetical protein